MNRDLLKDIEIAVNNMINQMKSRKDIQLVKAFYKELKQWLEVNE